MSINILIAESLNKNIIDEYVQYYRAWLQEDHSCPERTKSSSTDFTINYQPDITEEALYRLIPEYHALIIRPKVISAEMIHHAQQLKLIIRGGAGVNNIALDAAKKNHIIVENTPGENSVATAEFAFAAMMELVTKRKIQLCVEACKKYNPKPIEDYIGHELAGKKLAIIGLGNIGKKMLQRAQAFDMEVIAYTRNEKKASCREFRTLEEIIDQKPDIITLHLPLTEQTKNFIREEHIASLKKPIFLINTARPQLISAVAFEKGLASGSIIGAAIDGDYDVIMPYLKADRKAQCIITHHIADATEEALANITRQVLKQVFTFFTEGKIINRVV